MNVNSRLFIQIVINFSSPELLPGGCNFAITGSFCYGSRLLITAFSWGSSCQRLPHISLNPVAFIDNTFSEYPDLLWMAYIFHFIWAFCCKNYLHLSVPSFPKAAMCLGGVLLGPRTGACKNMFSAFVVVDFTVLSASVSTMLYSQLCLSSDCRRYDHLSRACSSH